MTLAAGSEVNIESSVSSKGWNPSQLKHSMGFPERLAIAVERICCVGCFFTLWCLVRSGYSAKCF